MSTAEYPRPEGLPHNPGYSQVAVASGSRMIHTAGQVSIDEHSEVVGAGDLAAQTAQAMRNVRLALAAAGASFADVVKLTTFVVNYQPEHRSIISQARAPFFTGRTPPASTLIGVSALAMPGWLVEIEAIAVLP
jgi:enamine deaminase RidA (YjgF/YER057c/UK114 family)